MKITRTPDLPNARGEAKISVTPEDFSHEENLVLQEFQKEISLPGFRKGHAPLDVVRQQVSPDQLLIGVYERLITSGLQQLVRDHPDAKIIGDPYDIDPQKSDDLITITLKLDLYPEAEVKSDARKKQKILSFDTTASEEEIDNAISHIQREQSSYEDTDTVEPGLTVKLKLRYLDAAGEELSKRLVFLGDQDRADHEKFRTPILNSKKVGDTGEIDRSDAIPESARPYQSDLPQISKLSREILDIKKHLLPELTDEFVQNLFHDDKSVNTLAELRDFTRKTIEDHKKESGLLGSVENFVTQLRDDGALSVTIPKTILDHEVSERMKRFSQQFNNDENQRKQFFEHYEKQNGKKLEDEIRQSSRDSLEKFFILRKIADLHELEIDREHAKSGDAETKLFAKLQELGLVDETQKINDPKNAENPAEKTKKKS